MPTQPKVKSLTKLKRERPAPEEWRLARNEISQGGDRSAAILAAAFTEDTLRFSISQRFWDINDKDFEGLCSAHGPLGSFWSMIELGYALGIYRDIFRNDLHVIRTIRNAFAHTMKPINFETPAVEKELSRAKYLDYIKSLPLEPIDEFFTPSPHVLYQNDRISVTTNREKYIFLNELMAIDIIGRGHDYERRAREPLLP